MRKKIKLFALPLIILLVLLSAGAFWNKARNHNETSADIAQASMDLPPVSDTPETDTAPAAGEDQAKPAESLENIIVEGRDPKFPRAIGKLDAPVTMYDFSSFTCPHCAQAHALIIPQLIKDYVQTGKLRIVFNDFPLNTEALDASKVSRCMPEDKYYNFISLLFASIENWASNHPTALVQNAVMAGLSEDKAKQCLADTNVEKAILENVQTTSAKYNVSATPTFVFNDGKKIIQGARQYYEFQMAIDGLIEEQKDKDTTKKQ